MLLFSCCILLPRPPQAGFYKTDRILAYLEFIWKFCSPVQCLNFVSLTLTSVEFVVNAVSVSLLVVVWFIIFICFEFDFMMWSCLMYIFWSWNFPKYLQNCFKKDQLWNCPCGSIILSPSALGQKTPIALRAINEYYNITPDTDTAPVAPQISKLITKTLKQPRWDLINAL